MKKKCLDDKVHMTEKFLAGEVGLILDKVIAPDGKESVKEDGRYFEFSDGERVHCRYAVGDGVVVAMSYEKAGLSKELFGEMPGWTDKSRANAAYLPHKFVVEGVRCVRVKDLTEEDMLRAGVKKNLGGFYLVGGAVGGAEKECWRAFGRMFNLRSSVPYALNPWVIVYDVTPVIGRAK